jgi:hypothetical protein
MSDMKIAGPNFHVIWNGVDWTRLPFPPFKQGVEKDRGDYHKSPLFFFYYSTVTDFARFRG